LALLAGSRLPFLNDARRLKTYATLPETHGELQGHMQWPGVADAFAAGTPSQLALFRRASLDEWKKNDEADQPSPEVETMFMFEGTRLIREIRCSGMPVP
jgi:hypothetical protein